MSTRKHLSANSLIAIISQHFSNIIDQRKRSAISIKDALMSSFSLFSLKHSSLLAFDRLMNSDSMESNNLKKMYNISKVPSDTQMRSIVDNIDPVYIKSIFKKIFSQIQRGKVLEDFIYHKGTYLCSIDGTGYFSSNKVNCDSCLVKNKRDGTKQYYHQMLSGVLAHPEKKEVVPIANEAIVKQDGSNKNDCELNASKRLLKDLRKEHPHLALTILGDSLFSKGPIIKLLKELKMHFILVAKESDHKKLFEGVKEDLVNRVKYFECIDDEGVNHKFRYVNGTILNYAHLDMSVNFLEYWETKNGKTNHWSWVTDHYINEHNLMKLMRGGRTRWKIENETFNTLKNQGYEFEHNFGHGYKNLSVNFALLMILAFMVDQVQELTCKLFNEALKKAVIKKDLWQGMRSIYMVLNIESYEDVLAKVVSINIFGNR